MLGAELSDWTAGVMIAALTVYALLGGADFGGGVWDLLARGPRKAAQRQAIEHAIGPIWEANHVWLIVVIVVLFSCFPPAFAAVGEGLNACLTIMLFGVVARGSAFVFRAYDDRGDKMRRVWGKVFSVSSVATPMLLGAALGAMASGKMTYDPDGAYAGDQWGAWLSPFPLSVGVFAVTAFAHLAAVYMCVEVEDEALRRDFRARALWSGGAMFVVGGVVRWLGASGAERFMDRLTGSAWSWPLAVGAGLLLLGSVWALRTRWWGLARLCSAACVAALALGFGLAQWPMLVAPQVTIDSAAAPATTHAIVLITLACGSVILIPSLYYLMRIFKGPRAFTIGR